MPVTCDRDRLGRGTLSARPLFARMQRPIGELAHFYSGHIACFNEIRYHRRMNWGKMCPNWRNVFAQRNRDDSQIHTIYQIAVFAINRITNSANECIFTHTRTNTRLKDRKKTYSTCTLSRWKRHSVIHWCSSLGRRRSAAIWGDECDHTQTQSLFRIWMWWMNSGVHLTLKLRTPKRRMRLIESETL